MGHDVAGGAEGAPGHPVEGGADDSSAPTLTAFAPDVTWPSDPDETVRPDDAGFQSLPDSAVDVGEVLDALPAWSDQELVVTGTLGEGGMGVVRRARQRSLGRDVAVKQLKPDHQSAKAQRKLLQEAWAAGCLEHPHIVPVYALARDVDGMPMIVQKRLDGDTWSTRLRADRAEGVLTREQTAFHLDVLERVAQAVAFAHDRGVIHRDVKPHNVILGHFGEVALLDWGLALALADGDPRLPNLDRARSAAGTPSYMAPEQLAEDDRRCGTGTDVYLLGGVLYEILLGRAPHRGASVAAILDQVRVNRPPLPAALDHGARELLGACLHDDPKARPSAQDFLAQLRSYRALAGARQLIVQALDERDAAEEALERGELAEALQRTSAARFGLVAAADAGAEVPDDARRTVAEPVVRYRLGQGDGEGALLLLDQLEVGPSALRTEAEQVAAIQRVEASRLEHLAGEADTDRGVRTRLFVGFVTMFSWGILPISAFVWEASLAPLSYGALFPAAFVMAMLSTGFTLWARDSLSLSIPNRVTAVGLPGATWLAVVALAHGWFIGVSPWRAMALAQAGWVAMALLAMPVFWRGMALVAAAQLVGLAVTAVRPSLVWLVIGVCDLLIGAVALYPERHRVGPLLREWLAGTRER